jgi:hypothetical protein
MSVQAVGNPVEQPMTLIRKWTMLFTTFAMLHVGCSQPRESENPRAKLGSSHAEVAVQPSQLDAAGPSGESKMALSSSSILWLGLSEGLVILVLLLFLE